MAQTTSRGRSAINGINVTPLVDITLVLLIVFIVTAKLIVRHDALAVDLPKAATGSEVQEVFSVAIAASGEVRVNGEALGAEDGIVPRAVAARVAHGDLRALIKADGAVPHARVMHVLDLLKQAGVGRVGFGVVPGPASSAASTVAAGTGAR